MHDSSGDRRSRWRPDCFAEALPGTAKRYRGDSAEPRSGAGEGCFCRGVARVEGVMVKTKKRVDVGIIMGSKSDWPAMEAAAKVLDELGITYEAEVISAHRTPDRARRHPLTPTS